MRCLLDNSAHHLYLIFTQGLNIALSGETPQRFRSCRNQILLSFPASQRLNNYNVALYSHDAVIFFYILHVKLDKRWYEINSNRKFSSKNSNQMLCCAKGNGLGTVSDILTGKRHFSLNLTRAENRKFKKKKHIVTVLSMDSDEICDLSFLRSSDAIDNIFPSTVCSKSRPPFTGLLSSPELSCLLQRKSTKRSSERCLEGKNVLIQTVTWAAAICGSPARLSLRFWSKFKEDVSCIMPQWRDVNRG